MSDAVHRSFKFRLLPNKAQHKQLAGILEGQRQLYNAALEERIGCYQKTGHSLSYMSQCKGLTELRKDAEFFHTPVNLQRWTIKRLDEAYAGFFRRVKKDKKAGFPRFRSKSRWHSFGFKEFCGIRYDGGRLRFNGISGGLRVHLHRPLPNDAEIAGFVFTRDLKGWSVCFKIKTSRKEGVKTGLSVGVDVGLKVLATLSTGEAIPNMRVGKRAEKQLRIRQRALSRCKRGSKRRAKVRASLIKLHNKVANTRRTHLHQVSAKLVSGYDVIALEKLNNKALASGMLAKSVNDAGWGMLKQFITYKAEGAGKRVIEVDPRNTSQACSGCGVIVPKKLSDRWHECPHCGLSLDRDHNAALFILGRSCSKGSQDKAVAYV